MEEILDKDIYLLDLSSVEYIPEIIFKLSSVLEKEEAREKKIYLKLGHVNLSQAQLLSIKSLINGVNSNLDCISSESILTDNIAQSLGIKVIEKSEEKPDESVEQENIQSIQPDYIAESVQNINEEENVVNKEESESDNNADRVQDELDVIFSSNSFNQNGFSLGKSEELLDIVEEEEYTKEDIEIEGLPTKYIKQTMRSGQVIKYEGNVIVIGDCHTGSEISASGDITVWGVLSGIAHAGIEGNKKARIRALKMNAIQLRIADCYSRRPDSLNEIVIEKTNSFTPEEARIQNGEIVVFKMND